VEKWLRKISNIRGGITKTLVEVWVCFSGCSFSCAGVIRSDGFWLAGNDLITKLKDQQHCMDLKKEKK